MRAELGSLWARVARRPARTFTWILPESHRRRLYEVLAAVTARGGSPDWHEIPTLVQDLDPHGARAILGYGSWYVNGLRKPTSFADVYLVVDDYSRFHESAFHAWMNHALPPNVYFLWTAEESHRDIRGKYNVISTADLERECGPALRDVYTAGRLTKLVWIAWVRDEATRDWLITQLIQAHRTLAPPALGLLPERFDLEEFSLEILALSYRGEARLEGWQRVRELHAAHADHYLALHRILIEAFAASTGLVEVVEGDQFRKRAAPEWQDLAGLARRLVRYSRRRGYLRWPRIMLTEPNLLDLAVNEAERKAGVRIDVTPRLRRHPLIYGLPAFLRVLRQRETQDRIPRS